MVDNVPITPGSGVTIATEQVGDGSHVQRVKATFGVPDTATDVSAANPLPATMDSGTTLNRLENVLIALRQLTVALAGTLPDPAGRTRVTVDNINGSATLATVSTVSVVNNVTAVATVSAVSKLNAAGNLGFPLDYEVYSLSNQAAALQRRQITVA